MRFVEVAAIRPHRCAVLPQVGSHHERGYIDTGSELGIDHVYVSVVAVERMAALIGWTTPADVERLASALVEAEARVAVLDGKVEALREQLAAVDVLESAGFTKRRRPGRPAGSKSRKEVVA